MPGIVGIISAQPQDNIARDLTRMIESVRHFDWYKVEQSASPDHAFACAHIHLGVLPTHNSPGRWLHGEKTDAYTLVEYDKPTQMLTITNDPFGMMPLFYIQIGDLLIFATELKAVL